MPGHPEAQRARYGLYESLQGFLKGQGEISFVSVISGDKQDVYVGGISDEPLSLKDLMVRGMAEIFVPKFLEYFERKHLSSFSMKAAIRKAEFEKFLDIMTESPLYEDKEIDVRDKLVMDLLKHDVLMVSTVFNVDLVGKGRKLSWRIEISLSRLKKDLNMIPLFRNLSEERKKEVRRAVFEDILRPLREPSMIKEILSNLDLISRDLAGFHPDDFERITIEHLDRNALKAVSRDLVGNITSLRKAVEKVHDAGMVERINYLRSMTRKVVKQLIGDNICDEDLFLELVRGKVFSPDEIPPDIYKKIEVHLEFDEFDESPEKFFTETSGMKEEAMLRERIGLLFEFLPALFSARRYPDIIRIFALSREKNMAFDIRERSALVEKLCDATYKTASEGSKEDHLRLLEVLSVLNVLGTYMLINLLDNSSRFVRRHVLEILPKRGDETGTFIIEFLGKKKGWYYTRNALIILAALGVTGPEAENIFASGLKSPEPAVRKEAVPGIPPVFGEKGAQLLIPLVKDADHDVRKKAVAALAAIRYADSGLLKSFGDFLKEETVKDETMKKEIMKYLTRVPVSSAQVAGLEEALHGILRVSPIMDMVRKETEETLSFKADALAALGAIGTPKSRKVLKKYSSHKEQVLSRAASAALEKFDARQ